MLFDCAIHRQTGAFIDARPHPRIIGKKAEEIARVVTVNVNPQDVADFPVDVGGLSVLASLISSALVDGEANAEVKALEDAKDLLEASGKYTVATATVKAN